MTWTTRPRSDIGQISMIRNGQGRQVVLIHGVGLRAEAWGGQLQTLAQKYAVLAVDMPGHGQSARLPGRPSLADFTDAIAPVISTSAVVIGHSFGAMIALDMAIRYPARVGGVVALNAVFQRDAAAKTAVEARASSLDGETVADPSAPLERWFGAEPSAARNACHAWLCTVDPAGYRDAYRVFATEDGPAESALAQLHCPALFLTGADEPNSTPAMSKRMAELAPDGHAVTVDGAAHMAPMTHAAEINPILEQFIQEALQ
ncbi:alpha/beta fold hydrolase [Roseovarius nanhaiticus]|uniref:Pimeloyl-ACP methyl ester carboxylesterase n=1 Tax=Roseovarius nanhaiticus TaxID=573024 RepID=A0A1N7H5F7_9RHOB|nr:alpha/beta hydrolase [Roseovarius nanhaiticus]SEL12142.1 Pimeloyl-ACP methyl ester carboxylesterase [Roseovarius nanhaiticus]SIS20086.1 Pimeloyl-ACP methyl ester carboxylesterase [Roseovarius nanhaiticus]